MTRAKTRVFLTKLSNSISPFSNSSSTLAPVATSWKFLVSSRSLAIEKAVKGWSPVIIMTLMPAVRQSLMAGMASSRIGSIKPTRPSKVKWRMSFSVYLDFFSILPLARAMTR